MDINLDRIIHILKNSKKRVLKTVFVFTVIGIIVSLIIKPQYQSNLSFYTKKSDYQTNINSTNLSQIMFSGSPLLSNHDFSIIDILSSNDIYEKMISYEYKSIESNLIDYWEINNSNKEENNIYKRKIENLTIKKLKNRITFNENRKSGLISISVRMEDRELSKEFLNIFFKQISTLLIKVNSLKSNERVVSIETLLEDYKVRVSNKEKELVEFLVQNKNINSSEVLLAKKNELERQRNALSTTYYALLKDLENAKVNESDSVPLLVVLDSPKIAHKKAFPPRKMIVISFFFLGFLIATAIEIYRERVLFESS